jgi:hypothetical protein
MELSWLLVPAVRLMVLETAPGLASCRICETAVEDTLIAAIAHYWNEHPRATALVVAGALGVTVLAAQPGARRRR